MSNSYSSKTESSRRNKKVSCKFIECSAAARPMGLRNERPARPRAFRKKCQTFQASYIVQLKRAMLIVCEAEEYLSLLVNSRLHCRTFLCFHPRNRGRGGRKPLATFLKLRKHRRYPSPVLTFHPFCPVFLHPILFSAPFG